ncbi:MAG: cytochrome c3 family protein [bacterium]
MIKKWSLLAFVFFLTFTITFGHLIAWALSAVDTNLDFIIINYTESHTTDKFAPVPFTHKRHYVDYEVPCRGCHHAWTVDVRENPIKCKECHKGKEVSKAILLRNAFHRCCLNCHRELRRQKKPTGPIGCKACHVVTTKESRR